MSSTRTESTIQGFSTSVAKKVGQRIFKSSFDKVVHRGNIFHIYVYESVNRDILDDFKSEWPEFKAFIVATAEYKNQPLRK